MTIPEIAFEHYFKVPVCKTEDYVIKFEEHIKGTFVHCNVFKWNKTVKSRLSEDWKVIATKHGGPIYALHDVSDQKHEKFLKLFGFTKLIELPDLKEIWIWSKHG